MNLGGRPINWLRGMMLNHMPLMMTCREFEDFILAYLEDELPRRQRFVFELHLKVCRERRDYLVAYRSTVEVAKRAFANPDAFVPDEGPEDLVTAVLAARDAYPTSNRPI